jgi:hypothetical protein
MLCAVLALSSLTAAVPLGPAPVLAAKPNGTPPGHDKPTPAPTPAPTAALTFAAAGPTAAGPEGGPGSAVFVLIGALLVFGLGAGLFFAAWRRRRPPQEETAYRSPLPRVPDVAGLARPDPADDGEPVPRWVQRFDPRSR